MEDRQNTDNGKREDFRRVRSAKGALTFRVLGVAVVLYWLYELVAAYLKGGPEAPSLALLLAGIVVLGGGGAFVAWLTWKAWKADRAAAEMTEEEVRELEALREEDSSDEQ